MRGRGGLPHPGHPACGADADEDVAAEGFTRVDEGGLVDAAEARTAAAGEDDHVEAGEAACSPLSGAVMTCLDPAP